jgi:hypothetical protein
MQNKRVHTAIDQLILDTKDLSMFAIERVVTDFERYWEVTDLRNDGNDTRRFSTKFGVEQAICAVIKNQMEVK